MKKNVMKALRTGLSVEELHDPSLATIVGGCGPMGTNTRCGPLDGGVEGTEYGRSICPAKPIFTGRARDF